MIIFIEAMHLLPHPFDMQAPILLPGLLRERQHSSSQLSFGSFRKPAAPPPAAGFFVLATGNRTAPRAPGGDGDAVFNPRQILLSVLNSLERSCRLASPAAKRGQTC
ncbi:hypothetical protein ABID08_005482 [Rhizobium binae]|uniref:Uncharacterized protein n=1 Tax=Rhizobium binae TaxID=1138190 RepID=A0ABV2MNR5_9HYPH|nr:hypothetical protein [Rhizobium binae]MBX4948470.1 hypothetical protein [Rhizobium binae]MBX4995387.1 hypothetical protein [Rhizobium binae]NKL51041.1 hypothetical protein [Rhizobium leguminosarum bv. viciae]QSY85558.1 hypothetical protein J2J99_28680 [Rhizobium binae]